jgi:hypothetical protein
LPWCALRDLYLLLLLSQTTPTSQFSRISTATAWLSDNDFISSLIARAGAAGAAAADRLFQPACMYLQAPTVPSHCCWKLRI